MVKQRSRHQQYVQRKVNFDMMMSTNVLRESIPEEYALAYLSMLLHDILKDWKYLKKSVLFF